MRVIGNLQIDKKSTKQIRIDSGIHYLLKVKAANEKVTIKTVIEAALAEVLEVKNVI